MISAFVWGISVGGFLRFHAAAHGATPLSTRIVPSGAISGGVLGLQEPLGLRRLGWLKRLIVKDSWERF
jgi:hypothetical protein